MVTRRIRAFAVIAGVLQVAREEHKEAHYAKLIEATDTKVTAMTLATMAPSAIAFGVMSEKRLAIFAFSALGFVAAVLFGFWFVLGLAD
jgi:hypothetical protein